MFNIEVIIPDAQHDEDREVGEIHLFDNDKRIGIIEYHISKGILHVDNLKNEAETSHAGVGTALMNKAIQIALHRNLGFAFEVAKGSELFYRSWIPRTFDEKISTRLFTRLAAAKAGDLKKITNESCECENAKLIKFHKQDSIGLDPTSFIKKKSIEVGFWAQKLIDIKPEDHDADVENPPNHFKKP